MGTEQERVNQAIESFCRSASQGLRAPLRTVAALSEALHDDYDEQLDARGRQFLRHVQESARHMDRLLDSLLNLARVTQGDLRRAQVDLTALANAISDRLRAAEPARNAELIVEKSLTAEGDEPLLAIALENLFGNAWKFTSKRNRTQIEFGRRQDGASAIYFVRDNGAGFDMRNAPKLFAAFARLHPAKDFEGTGMGLAIVRRIAERHDGRVWAEGEIDKGATFYFTLRAAS